MPRDASRTSGGQGKGELLRVLHAVNAPSFRGRGAGEIGGRGQTRGVVQEAEMTLSTRRNLLAIVLAGAAIAACGCTDSRDGRAREDNREQVPASRKSHYRFLNNSSSLAAAADFACPAAAEGGSVDGVKYSQKFALSLSTTRSACVSRHWLL